MKKYYHTDSIPDGMADIKSGDIFEVPPGYFSQLNDRLFNQDGHIPPHQDNGSIKSLRPWMVAASVAIIISLTWWYTTESFKSIKNLADQSELQDYIQSTIMDYELKTLTDNLSGEDLNSLSQNESNIYQLYIQEHLKDFDDLMFNQ